MKKSLLSFLSIVLLAGGVTGANATAPIAGAPCTKVGTTFVINGLQFTCVKAGKKLIWNNGVRISRPATPTPTPTPTPTTVPLPTEFKNLFANRSGLALATWNNLAKAQIGSKVMLPPVEIYTGPNTVRGISSPLSALQYVANMFPNAYFPRKIVIFYYSFTDLSWGQDKSRAVMGQDQYQAVINAHGGPLVKCNRQNDCLDGDAYIGADGTDYIAIGEPNVRVESSDFPFSSGGVEGCEFYHSLALMNYFHNNATISTSNSIMSSNYPPQWIGAASENLVIAAIQSSSNQQKFKSGYAQKSHINQNFKDVGLSTFSNYLDLKNLNIYWSNNSGHFFQEHSAMGDGLMEVLVGLKGPSVMLDFFNLMSQGTSFSDAFQKIMGVTWQEAEPELEKTLYDKYLQNY